MLSWLTIFSALSFFVYGFGCVFTVHMAKEFERYGLAHFRVMTGVLQILGALGLTLGVFGFPVIGMLAALGLSLQMFFGVLVRIRVRDHLSQCLPAFFYFCLNAVIAIGFSGF